MFVQYVFLNRAVDKKGVFQEHFPYLYALQRRGDGSSERGNWKTSYYFGEETIRFLIFLERVA